LANYFGTYTAFATNQFSSNEIRATNGTATKVATFAAQSVQISAVPEPTSMASMLLSMVAGGMMLFRRKR
jgi:hypothetical protein